MENFFKKHKKQIRLILVFTISLFFIYIFYKLYKLGILTNRKKLFDYLGDFSYLAPFVFIILKVGIGFIPFIPNTVFIFIGFALFGQIPGLILNYLSSLMTDIINFSLTRIYGKRALNRFLSKKNYKKYEKLSKKSKKNFRNLLFLTCLIPFGPDNGLAFLTGLRKIDFKDYLKIISLGKLIEIIIIAFFVYNIRSLLI